MSKLVEASLLVSVIGCVLVLLVVAVRIKHPTVLPSTETTLQRTICTDEAPCE